MHVCGGRWYPGYDGHLQVLKIALREPKRPRGVATGSVARHLLCPLCLTEGDLATLADTSCRYVGPPPHPDKVSYCNQNTICTNPQQTNPGHRHEHRNVQGDIKFPPS